MAGFTAFPNGITSLGIPTFGTGILPPFTGKYLFVQEVTTAGVSAGQGTAQQPFNTLDQALAQCTAGHNDVVFMIGTIHTTATLNWNKNNTHLVALCAPSANDRGRISSSGSTVFTPLVNVTAAGCIFSMIGTFHGFASATAQVCWAEAGGRNYYNHCQFLGGGNLTAAAHAGMRSLTVSGADGENVFDDCTIGLDTVLRATGTNASLEFLAGSPRNRFNRPIFQSLVSNAADVHITVGSGGIDRYAFFDHPVFLNAIESGGSTMSAAITANASAGGAIVLRQPISLGATAIATTGPVYGDASAIGAATSGIAIKLT